jgi:hypothetical protein
VHSFRITNCGVQDTTQGVDLQPSFLVEVVGQHILVNFSTTNCEFLLGATLLIDDGPQKQLCVVTVMPNVEPSVTNFQVY